MNTPKVQTNDPPTEGASPDHHPDGTMPHGIPKGTDDHDATALPTSDRHQSETAAVSDDK